MLAITRFVRYDADMYRLSFVAIWPCATIVYGVTVEQSFLVALSRMISDINGIGEVTKSRSRAPAESHYRISSPE